MNRKTSIFLTALLAGLMAATSANAEGRIEGSPVIVEGGAIVGPRMPPFVHISGSPLRLRRPAP
jgi:hypothetical protein